MATQKQIEANRQNALKSTGPKTLQGKTAVRLNSLRHGLQAKDAILPGESTKDFLELTHSLRHQHQPASPIEEVLVDLMALALWRLHRQTKAETELLVWTIQNTDATSEYQRTMDQEEEQTSTPLGFGFYRDSRAPGAILNLSRYHSIMERSFYRSLHELQRLQTARSGSATDRLLP